jgi:hypothetical protein
MRVENSSGSPPDALPYKISRILRGSLVRRVHGSLMIHYGPTGGTLRYDAIVYISFSDNRLGVLEDYGVSARTLYKNFPLP